MEQLIITSSDKEEIYKEVLPQIKGVVSDETDPISNMANVAAILKEAFGFFWVGFYIVKQVDGVRSAKVDKSQDAFQKAFEGKKASEEWDLPLKKELVLGPFQGPLACTRIQYGRGVCGTAWKEKKTLVVPDVEQFPGHIACSSLSRSEIVVPVLHGKAVIAVLDIDSKELNAFDGTDAFYLEQVAEALAESCPFFI